MGCSSGHMPCQPPAPPPPPPPPQAEEPLSGLSSVCDAECGLPQDGADCNSAGSAKPNLPLGPGSELVMPKSPELTLERLALATGGTEKSWYRCVFPFGFISLVIGVAGTSVTFTFNTLHQIKVMSMIMMISGALMLLVAAVYWRARRARRRAKKECGFFGAVEQGTL